MWSILKLDYSDDHSNIMTDYFLKLGLYYQARWLEALARVRHVNTYILDKSLRFILIEGIKAVKLQLYVLFKMERALLISEYLFQGNDKDT